MRPEQGRRFDFALTGIALLAAFLNTFNIWNNRYANAYYTAAVTSMLQSWHNFFYASFDPAGYVTVDKPPVVFWIQAAFAYIFGVHGWSVILPQALAGIGSVLLMYVLVKPAFGKTAARLASLITACTPVAVAVSRTNNIDSMLVFTLLVATWMLFRGIRSRKVLWLLGAFAVTGIAFNMKMLQAYMVVPAFYLFYLIAFKGEWKKKIAVLAAATVVLVGISVSYAVAVELVPQENRPYIGGSQTNSVLELAFGYNGIQRLKGMGRGGQGPVRAPSEQQQVGLEGGTGPERQQMQQETGAMSGQRQEQQDGGQMYGRTAPQDESAADGRQMPQDNNMPGLPPDVNGISNRQQAQTAQQDGSSMPGGQQAPQENNVPDGRQMPQESGNNSGYFNPGDAGRQDWMPGPGGAGPRGQGGGMFGTGTPGPLRLFQSSLSGQISWLMPFVAFACVCLLAGLRRGKALTDKEKETLFWLAWLLPAMVFFSVAGFFHQYYLIMLAPPIAALAGGGWAGLWKCYREQAGWQKWLLPAGLLATTVFELYILKPYQQLTGSGWAIGIGLAGAGLVLVLLLASRKQKLASFAAMAGMLVLLVAPLYWSATPLIYGDNSMLPQAGFSQQGFGQRQGGGGGQVSGVNDKLLAYVTAHNTGEPILFATTEASTAESYIIETGKAVIAMGGFSGSDPILTVDKLQQMVANKEVKFFLIPSGAGFGGRGGTSEVMEWIRANSTEVPKEEWQMEDNRGGPLDRGNGNVLYKINDNLTKGTG